MRLPRRESFRLLGGVMKPDYEPKLFGAPMEWDDDLNYWADFGCISVTLCRDDDGTFSWLLNHGTGARGEPTLQEAVRGIEAYLNHTFRELKKAGCK